MDNPQSHNALKDTQPHTMAWTYTQTQGHTHTHKVTTSCSHIPESSQWTPGPGTHPGQNCPDTGSAVLPALAQQPEPTLRACQQHYQQIKSECAKIKPKGCDKPVPFPQDSALTQVLLSAINIFILILKDISITSLALNPARRYLA